MRKIEVAVLVAVSAFALFAGNVCTWVGGSGKWSDSSNWEGGVKPVSGNGDDVHLAAESENAVISNDIANISIAYLRFTGNNAVRLVGEKIKMTEGVRALNSSTLDVQLGFSGNGSIYCGDQSLNTDNSVKVIFNGDIEVANGAMLYISGGYDADFYGAIKGGETTQILNGGINWKEGVFSFYGPVKAKKVMHYSASQSIFKFYSQENEWEEFEASSYTCCYFMRKNVMPPGSILSFSAAGGLNNYKGVYFYADQTISHIAGVDPKEDKYSSDVFWIRNATGADDKADLTLTLVGRQDAKTYAKFAAGSHLGKWSVVWAPTGNFTQEFAEREQGVTGTLTVSNGTVRLSGAGKFAALPSLIIKDGACFDLASQVSGALNKLMRLELGANARFMLASTAVSPCSQNPLVMMGEGSKFVLPSGAAMAVGDLFAADGRYVPSGVYTGTGNSGTKVSWIDGEGTLTVTSTGMVAAWDQAQDGQWNSQNNWGASILPFNKYALLTVNGASYTVTVESTPAAAPTGIRIGNSSDGKITTLAVAAQMTVCPVSGEILDVGRGGKIQVPSGGDLQLVSSDEAFSRSTPAARLHDGGKLELTGGSFTGRGGFYGKFVVDDGGELKVSAGSFSLTNKTSRGDGIWVEDGGKIELASGGFYSSCYTLYSRPVTMRGGIIDCSGDARFYIGGGYGKYFGNGSLVLRGSSQLCPVPGAGTARVLLSPLESGDVMTVDVTEHASWNMSEGIQSAVGFDCGNARTIINFSSDAGSDLGYVSHVGCVDGYGEMNICAGSVRAGSAGIQIGSLVNTLEINPAKAVYPKGRVTVAGGSFLIDGGLSNQQNEGYAGLMVGICNDYSSDNAAYGSMAEGGLLVTGGLVTNKNGFVSVGLGRAKGRVVQTGGNIVSSVRPVSIGAFGGQGEWIVSNGVSRILGMLYLGGILPSQWDRGLKMEYSADAPGTKGSLRVSGGEMHVAWGLTAGCPQASGSAEIEIGPGGLLDVGVDMELANTKLVYRFGPSGIGRVQIGRDLIIGENTTLEIDVGSLTDKAGSYFIATSAREVSGEFSSVVIRGVDNPTICRVRKIANGFKLSFVHGTTIVVR
jgi:hypothetical protein